MKAATTLLLALAGTLAAACAMGQSGTANSASSSSGQLARDDCVRDPIVYCTVPMVTLFNDRKKWLNRRVAFKGFVTFRGGKASMWLAKSFSEAAMPENSIEIDDSAMGSPIHWESLKDQYIQVSGVLALPGSDRNWLAITLDAEPDLVPWTEERQALEATR